MRIAGVHVERRILVVRDDKSGKVSYSKFNTLEELSNSKEIKRSNEIYINAGENNFLVKTKFFPDKNPEQAKNYVLKHLNEFSVGKGREYLIKIAAVPNKDGSHVYIIECKEGQIYARIDDLPIENYRISGVIPDNFAVSYPFMIKDDLDGSLLVVEIGAEELILNRIDGRAITFTRSVFFEREDLVGSLKKEIDILLHRAGSVKKIYFTGKFTDKSLKKLKKEITSYKNKISKLKVSSELPSDAILAYGLSLSPVIGFNNDLTPEYIATKREELNKEAKFEKFIRIPAYVMGVLFAVPLLLLIAGEIWIFAFDRQIGKLRNSYEKVKKIQTEVNELKGKLKLQQETRTPIPWGLFLSEISRSIPDNVCLIQLESEPTMIENKRGFIFYLTGEGETQEAVMSFYSKIQNIEIIEETNIKKIKNERGITSYVFTAILYSE
jgi:prefoldin subunit 5